MKPNLPTLTCHACGYDMHDRKEHDLCPECFTPFIIAPEAYPTKWKLIVPLICTSIAIVIMPFLMLFSFILLVPAFIHYRSQVKVCSQCRITHWAEKRLKLNYILMLICVAELWILIIISTIWPNALNWW